jgi:hypothetical protein
MITSELIRSSEELIASLDKAMYLWNTVELLAKTFRILAVQIGDGTRFAWNTNNRQNVDSEFDSKLEAVVPEIKETKQFETFEAVQASRQALAKFFDSLPAVFQFKELDPTEALNDYSSAYQAYFTDQTRENAWSLLVRAEQLSRKLVGLRSAALFYMATASRQGEVGDNQPLTIFIKADLSISEIAAKLAALSELYDEVAMLLDISVEQHPLRVLKIESDSLFISVAGHPIVISIVTAICTASIMTIQQGWTQHGKMEQAEYELRALREAFDLTELIKARGVNVEDSEDRIRKASEIAVKRLAILIGGESSVEVNGELYVLSMNESAKMLEGQRQRRLENGSPQSPR